MNQRLLEADFEKALRFEIEKRKLAGLRLQEVRVMAPISKLLNAVEARFSTLGPRRNEIFERVMAEMSLHSSSKNKSGGKPVAA